jgi:hypothetical protein
LLARWRKITLLYALLPGIEADETCSNQTNLAIKGIIGIEAMAQIANRTGHFTEGANYTRIAHSYVKQWQVLGIAHDATPPHATLAYGMNDTYGLLYNLFGDRELGLQLVPGSVYEIQDNFYPTVFNEYGVVSPSSYSYYYYTLKTNILTAARYTPHLHQE